ncbi:CHRD domain-containing protein [Paenochrobactrum glaciei]|uniref:CHRD domain-containing protein n=1 Tax=Paenochrobactrum glaciei TaxID=486407 RepID=UPI0035BBCD14
MFKRNLWLSSSILFFIFSGSAYAQNIINVEDYNFKKSNENYFANSYSGLTLSVQSKSNAEAPAYIALPDTITNTHHVQKVFAATKKGKDGQAEFDVYFPLLNGVSEIPLKIYTESVNPAEITQETPYIPYLVQIENKKSGHALMLYQENKERNVRVFQTTGSMPGNPEGYKSVDYVWYGRNLDNASQVLVNSIAHITEEKGGSLLTSLNLQQVSGGMASDIRIFNDPANDNKAHLYLQTDQTGLATLRLSPTDKVVGGQLIYWPFANNISETARIVVYNPDSLSKDFIAPVIRKNPVTIGDNPVCDVPVFDIANKSPHHIDDNGRLYLLINGKYDTSIVTENSDSLRVSGSGRFVNTSTLDLPQPNDAQYVYVAEDGTVGTSAKYSFFAYAGDIVKQLNPDGNMIVSCEKDQKAIYNFNTTMSPMNEIPPVTGNKATGEVTAQYDRKTKTLQWKVTYSGLSGTTQTPVAAHFHGPASPAQNADIIINIPADQLTSPIEGQQVLTDEQEDGLIRGLWYFNIHTKQNPMGVLRGQLEPQ